MFCLTVGSQNKRSLNNLRKVLVASSLMLLSFGAMDALAQEVQTSSLLDGWVIHGQYTAVDQWHAPFRAAYSGTNSLSPSADSSTTMDATLFMGRALWSGAELYLNPEIDQGFGLNNTLGVAGFPSGDAYKVGFDTPYYRMPRAFIRQTVTLGGESQTLEDAPNQIGKTTTADQLVITVGKFAVVDVFDTNAYAHDPRADFLNWSMLEGGAFDYAADAWGFTDGAAIEWTQSWWTSRSGVFALSTVPNGTQIDTDFKQYELIQEFEARHTLGGHPGKVKLLAYVNRGYMGSYSDAIAWASQQAAGTVPDTAQVRRYASRTGGLVNIEQEISPSMGLFARYSKNNGAEETFEFTDITQSLSGGVSVKGDLWGRAADTVGVGLVQNRLSPIAQRYFSLGGLSVLVGDGAMTYAPETITEMYYAWQVHPNFTVTTNFQHIVNPAYNTERGPVNLLALRLHAAF